MTEQEAKELELFNTWWYSIEDYMDEKEAAEQAWFARSKLDNTINLSLLQKLLIDLNFWRYENPDEWIMQEFISTVKKILKDSNEEINVQ